MKTNLDLVNGCDEWVFTAVTRTMAVSADPTLASHTMRTTRKNMWILSRHTGNFTCKVVKDLTD